MSTVKLTIDGQEVEVEAGSTVMQACEKAGTEVPRFCYHERLSIAGNCRMCLVQIEGGPPKPAASCAMPAGDGMVVHTKSEMVQTARKGVMEFLLANHPLDCPICDQAGECDLQDQAMAYGRDHSRFVEDKRAVKEKDLGPLVKTTMTRCIHCTRCVRFATEVAGVPELGATGRGGSMEIGTYVEKTLSSELSGNIVDLCPVGALTSKPYEFLARPWELTKTESIDVLDGVGSNIRIDSRGAAVMRVVPREHDDVNEEWISDKTRHAIDGLKKQRLDRPYVRKGGKLQPATWEEALGKVAQKLRNADAKKIAAISGGMADVEAQFALKQLMDNLGVANMDCRQSQIFVNPDMRSSYLFNTTIAGIEDADACLIIGSNPRHEAAILNTRIRKRYLERNFPIALVGEEADLTYKYDHLGTDVNVLEEIASGKHPFAKVLKSAEKPMLILGEAALGRSDAAAIAKLACDIAEKFGMIQDEFNGFNVLHSRAATVGGLDVGFVPGKGGKATSEIIAAAEKGNMDVVYLLGADEIDMKALKKTFVVYQGHHGDEGAHAADVILPGAAYTEKNATYVNTEGRVQRTMMAVEAPGEAKEDWKIIRALSETIGETLPYNNLDALRKAITETVPVMGQLDVIIPSDWKSFGKKGKVLKKAFEPLIENFFMTDVISRNSSTMAACTENREQQLKQLPAA